MSGFLKCNAYGASYIVNDARSYACSSFLNGRARSNGVRVRRDALENTIVGPIKDELLSPDRVKRMAAEVQKTTHRAHVNCYSMQWPRTAIDLGCFRPNLPLSTSPESYCAACRNNSLLSCE